MATAHLFNSLWIKQSNLTMAHYFKAADSYLSVIFRKRKSYLPLYIRTCIRFSPVGNAYGNSKKTCTLTISPPDAIQLSVVVSSLTYFCYILFLMEKINTEMLKNLVEARPAIWYKVLDIYKKGT